MTEGRIEGRREAARGGRLRHVTARAAAGGQPIKRTSLYVHAEANGRTYGRLSDDSPEDRRSSARNALSSGATRRVHPFAFTSAEGGPPARRGVIDTRFRRV